MPAKASKWEHLSTQDRFDRWVDKSGDCWLWLGKLKPDGYAEMVVSGKNIPAHRLSYQLHVGPIPPGLLVCHTCDIRHCVKPDHLWTGTQADNIRDCVAKGRHTRMGGTSPERAARGNGLPQAKLTPEKVREMRRLYAAGFGSLSAVGALFGVNGSSAHAVIQGRSWRHV